MKTWERTRWASAGWLAFASGAVVGMCLGGIERWGRAAVIGVCLGALFWSALLRRRYLREFESESSALLSRGTRAAARLRGE